MGSSYLKNHLGFSLSDEQFEDIPYPTTELVSHVTQKTIQSGAILGTLVIGPIGAVARSSTRNLEGVLKTSARYGRNGVLIGLALGPVMTLMRTRTLTKTEIVDRDYRLRHNRGQVRVDRGTIVGAAMGYGINMARKRCPITGAVFGISAGVLTMAAYNSATSSK